MAALIDEAYLRSTFNIHREVEDARLTPYIAAASRRLIRWVGADNYAEATLAAELELAEGLIAMHLLELNLNTAIRPNGIVRRETVENSVVVEYLSPKDVEALSGAYLEQAEEIAADWTSAAGGAIALLGMDDGGCEAATRNSCGTC